MMVILNDERSGFAELLGDTPCFAGRAGRRKLGSSREMTFSTGC